MTPSLRRTALSLRQSPGSSQAAHHWKVHEGGWRLIRTDDGVVALPPVADDYGPERGWLRSRAADTPSTG